MDELTELTPRTSGPAPARPRSGRGWLSLGVVALIVLAIGFVLVKGLSDAALFFRNADEAIAERDELGDSRFRLQGTVVPGTVQQEGDLVLFAVSYEGAIVDVVHRGDPPQLFQPGVPVVLEGRFSEETPDDLVFVDAGGTAAAGYHFASDRILVKHDNTYVADNGDRLRDAEQGGTTAP